MTVITKLLALLLLITLLSHVSAIGVTQAELGVNNDSSNNRNLCETFVEVDQLEMDYVTVNSSNYRPFKYYSKPPISPSLSDLAMDTIECAKFTELPEFESIAKGAVMLDAAYGGFVLECEEHLE